MTHGEAIYEGAMAVDHVRVSLYDLEGSEINPFVDLLKVRMAHIWNPNHQWQLSSRVGLLSPWQSSASSQSWRAYSVLMAGQARVRMVEDRLRGLKLRIPIQDTHRAIPTMKKSGSVENSGEMAGFNGLRQAK
jgi:hypothetical protein